MKETCRECVDECPTLPSVISYVPLIFLIPFLRSESLKGIKFLFRWVIMLRCITSPWCKKTWVPMHFFFFMNCGFSKAFKSIPLLPQIDLLIIQTSSTFLLSFTLVHTNSLPYKCNLMEKSEMLYCGTLKCNYCYLYIWNEFCILTISTFNIQYSKTHSKLWTILHMPVCSLILTWTCLDGYE